MINHMPTAYDVNRVIEQLEQQAGRYLNCSETYANAGAMRKKEHASGNAASYKHAIKIVKNAM